MAYTREDWEAAKADLMSIEKERLALLEPTSKAYAAACHRLDEIEDDLPESTGRCEGCDKPIFEGDPHYNYADGVTTCGNCAPMLSELVDQYKQYSRSAVAVYEELGFETSEEVIKAAESLELDLQENGDRRLLASYLED
ncbi:hypothetical protein [Pseudovibrio sp. Ad26]|uniref:hypothetical protein n=1 Tax=Pseudovibrio sp. Ad26 TaxID=989410 RepID=UPI0007AEA215|nr:hypothetical protein [Pseudovibrio sp. Ad26]KZL10665.1 hypothetical protein PsAD26_03029 [Pseudovibrio sp. Ad26]